MFGSVCRWGAELQYVVSTGETLQVHLLGRSFLSQVIQGREVFLVTLGLSDKSVNTLELSPY